VRCYRARSLAAARGSLGGSRPLWLESSCGPICLRRVSCASREGRTAPSWSCRGRRGADRLGHARAQWLRCRCAVGGLTVFTFGSTVVGLHLNEGSVVVGVGQGEVIAGDEVAQIWRGSLRE